MDLTGTIIQVMPAQSGVSQRSGNPWMSQDYVLEVPAQYPRRMVFRIFGEDRIRQFNIQQGEQNVTVQFDIDAHEYNGRWFNEIKCYNVVRSAGQQQAQPTAAPVLAPPSSFPPPPPFPPQPAGGGQADDLPF